MLGAGAGARSTLLSSAAILLTYTSTWLVRLFSKSFRCFTTAGGRAGYGKCVATPESVCALMASIATSTLLSRSASAFFRCVITAGGSAGCRLSFSAVACVTCAGSAALTALGLIGAWVEGQSSQFEDVHALVKHRVLACARARDCAQSIQLAWRSLEYLQGKCQQLGCLAPALSSKFLAARTPSRQISAPPSDWVQRALIQLPAASF